tara:strand:- start:684 stop:1457 length:774 start_codon:yes stop_codon:yes gene_type:complete
MIKGPFIALFLLGIVFINILFMNSARAESDLIAVAAEHPMLQYQENDEIKGPSAEILKLLLQTSELEAPLDLLPWSRAYHTVLNRKNTLVVSMVRTQAREEQFHWLIKVSELVRGFISLKSKPENSIRTISEAKSKTIIVIRDSYGHHSLMNLGFSEKTNLYVVSTLKHGIALFLSGKVDLIYTDPNVLTDYFLELQQDSEALITVHILPETRRESYIAANINTDIGTLEKLNLAANKLQTDPNYQYYLAFKALIKK